MTQTDDQYALRQVARRIERLRREMRGQARGSQAAYRSVEITDGPVSHYDDTGTPRLQVGIQPDGNFGVAEVNAPPPPVPTAPDVVPVQGGVLVAWDGTFVDAPRPSNLAYVEVHVSNTPDFVADDTTQVSSFVSAFGGTFRFDVSAAAGMRYFALVAKNNAGVESVKSEEVSAQAILVTVETDGDVPPQVTSVTAQSGVRSVFLNWPAVTNNDMVEYHIYGGSATGFAVDNDHFLGKAYGTRFVAYQVWDAGTAAMVQLSGTQAGFFRVVAVDGDGAGTVSDEVTATPILIETPDLDIGVVGTVNISDDAVTALKLADEAVTTAKIALDAITSDLIAAGAVTATEISDGAISTPKLAAGAVTAAKIAADTITANEIAAGAIATAELAAGAVTAAKIAADTITANEIAANAITANELAANAVTAAKILAGEVGTDQLAANSVAAGKIAANAVTADTIAANAVTADKIAANAVTADKLEAVIALVSTLLVGDKISIQPSGTNNGIRIELNNGGHIYLPADGTDVDLDRVSARFTDATVENNLAILGASNRIGGVLNLDNLITDPVSAPAIVSQPDQSPVIHSVNGAYAGLGKGATKWQTGVHTASNGIGQSQLHVYEIDKNTGAVTDLYAATVQIYNDYEPNAYYTDTPTPQILTFGSVSTHAAFMMACPQYNWTANDGLHAPVSGNDGPAFYQMIVIRASDSAVVHNFRWEYQANYYNPAITTDGTYVYVAAVSKINGQIGFWRYTIGSATATQLWGVATPGGLTGLTGLFYGIGDLAAQRVIVHDSGTICVLNASNGARVAGDEWAPPEYCRGIQYDSGRFYIHGGSGKMYKMSTLKAAANRICKYTWYNSTSGVESKASPTTTYTQRAREWLKFTSSAIPAGSNSAAPDSVRQYIDAHRQADMAVGITTRFYEIPTTTGVDSPATNGFAAVSASGSLASSAVDGSSIPYTQFMGDGKWRLDPTKDLNDTGWIVPTLGNGWANAGGGWETCAYRKKGGIVYLKGVIINGTNGQAPFFLPVGMRPALNKAFPYTAMGPGRTQVRTDGAVYVDNGTGNTGWFLSGISFVAEA